MDARVENVILPLAKELMTAEQARDVSGQGTLTWTVLHEISHGIGPAFSRKDGKQVDIREAMGPIFGALEEAKADVVGMFGLIWLGVDPRFDDLRQDTGFRQIMAPVGLGGV